MASLSCEVRPGLYAQSLEYLRTSNVYEAIRDSLEIPDDWTEDKGALLINEKEVDNTDFDRLSESQVGKSQQNDRERSRLKQGFTLGQENLEAEVIPSEEGQEEEEEWNIHDENEQSSYNMAVIYEGQTFRNKNFGKSQTIHHVRSTLESPTVKNKASKVRKSDRKIEDGDPVTPKLMLPLEESTSFKGKSSRRLIGEPARVHFDLEEEDKEKKFESKRTQEFSVAGLGSRAGDDKSLPPGFSPHASYPKPGTNDKRMSFAMHLNRVDDISETKTNKSNGSDVSKEKSKSVVEGSSKPKPNPSRKHRPSMLQMFSGSKEAAIEKLRSEKEKELERSRHDVEFIKQISREVKEEQAIRKRKASAHESSVLHDVRSINELTDQPSRKDIPDDLQSVTKPAGDSGTLNLDRPSVIHFNRTTTITSNHQNGMFDSSLMMPSPIISKHSPQKGQTTLKLLDVMKAVSTIEVEDLDNIEPRASANFGTAGSRREVSDHQVILNTSNTNVVLSPSKISGLADISSSSKNFREVLGLAKKRSMVEYIVKSELSQSFMLRDQDHQAVSGLGSAVWTKIDRLKSTLNNLFPDYSLDMHATVDVDTLIDIVQREFGKLKSTVTELNSKLETVASEKDRNKKKLTELEIMMKSLLEKMEFSQEIAVHKTMGKGSSIFLTPQITKQNETSAHKKETNGLGTNLARFHNPTFGNVEDITMVDVNQVSSNFHIKLDYPKDSLNQTSNNLNIAINTDRGGRHSEKRIMSVDLRERKTERLANPELLSCKHFPEESEIDRPAFYRVDREETGETLQIDNASVDNGSIDQETQMADLFGTEFETHFIYKQEKGRFTLRKNSSSISRAGECSCSAKCQEHKPHELSKSKLAEARHVDLTKKEIKLGPRNMTKSILDERRVTQQPYNRNILDLTKEATSQNLKHYFPRMEKPTYSLSAREKMKPVNNLLGKFDGLKDALKTPRSLKLSRGKFISLKPSSSKQNLIN